MPTRLTRRQAEICMAGITAISSLRRRGSLDRAEALLRVLIKQISA